MEAFTRWIYAALRSFALLMVSFNTHSAMFDEFEETQAPIFVTPSRMSSSYEDSPNSVTRLETEDLYSLGITTVTDALRLVPGMLVSDVQSLDPAIGYHGTNVNVPRRMEVLFNSNSIYRPGYANLQWQRLPVDISDLTAIEVIRGSNVVDFGSNAFMGTVNLIPAQPVLAPTVSAEALTGSGDQREFWLQSHFSSDSGEYIMRYSHKESNGYESLADGTDIDDYLAGDNFLFLGEVEISEGRVFDFTIATNQYMFTPTRLETLFVGDEDLEFAIPDSEDPTSDESSSSVMAKYSGADNLYGDDFDWYISGNYVNYKRDQDIDLCIRSFFYDPLIEQLDASPNVHLVREDIPLVLTSSLNTGVAELDQSIIAPLSASDLALLEQIGQRTLDIGPIELLKNRCGTSDISVKEERYEIELSSNLHQKGQYSLSSVLNISDSTATSKHYLNGSVDRTALSFANNFRYQLVDGLVLNLGLHLETNDRVNENYFSHRSALNWKFNKNNVFRVTASHSERSPDIHELDRYWNYYVVFDEGVTDHLGNSEASLPRVAKSPDTLESEKIDSAEISYIFFNHSHTFDMKLFRENSYDLISEPFFYMDFNLTNNGKSDLRGSELAYVYQSRDYPGLKFGLNHLYLDNESNNDFEKTLYSKNSSSMYFILPLNSNYTFGSTFYYLDELADHGYERYDLNLSYTKYYKDVDLKLRLNYRRYPEIIYSYTEVSATQPIASKYENNNRFYFSLSIEY